jgi:hypothetical protein
MLLLEDVYKQLITEAVSRDKIISAIQNKEVVTIYYIGDDPNEVLAGYRQCEILTYGVNKQSGNPCVRVWILPKSVSKSYPPGKTYDPLTWKPGYRMLRVDRINSIRKTGKNFNTPRPKYNPQDKDMSGVFFHVTY